MWMMLRNLWVGVDKMPPTFQTTLGGIPLKYELTTLYGKPNFHVALKKGRRGRERPICCKEFAFDMIKPPLQLSPDHNIDIKIVDKLDRLQANIKIQILQNKS
jgi:hypothetical protein